VRNLAVKRAVKVGDVRSYQLKREPWYWSRWLALTRPFRRQGIGEQTTGSRVTPLPWGILHCFVFWPAPPCHSLWMLIAGAGSMRGSLERDSFPGLSAFKHWGMRVLVPLLYTAEGFSFVARKGTLNIFSLKYD
jgi:hypothetical protein